MKIRRKGNIEGYRCRTLGGGGGGVRIVAFNAFEK